MGEWLARGRGRRRASAALPSLLEGALLVGSGVALATMAGGSLDAALDRVPTRPRCVARGIALKPALSLRALLDAANEVAAYLERGDLPHARRALGWHLVSRDTRSLSAAEVAGAAIESVAENLSDSVVAPIMAYRAAGLRGAYAYRMINTADAMLGYRTPELEWYGKFAARTDDVMNALPARVTAAFICLCAPFGGGSARRARRVMVGDARRTSSPNAGWPMAAMAGALGVRLTKRDVYSLNDSGRPPTERDIVRARRVVLAAAALSAVLADVA